MDVTKHERAVEVPELPRREPYRTWPGSLVILAVIVAYVGIWVVADNEIGPRLQPLRAGVATDAGQGVTFVPLDGWDLDRTDSTTSSQSTTTVLAGPGGTMQLVVSRWTGTLAEQVARQKESGEAFGDVNLLDDDAAFSTPSGLSGTTFGYASQRTQGRVWVSVDEAADRSVVVTGVATDSVFTQVLPSFQTMLNSVRQER